MIGLPKSPTVSSSWRSRLERLADRTARDPPRDLASIVRDELGIDLASRYAGIVIPHPFGKASGQLSCTLSQVEADVAAGIAFVVLKTVIAESAMGVRSMEAWTQRETKMRVERRMTDDGRSGWTVTWKGRGWSGSLADYLRFFERSLDVARPHDVPIVPSVKYHLPVGDERFREDEYRHTTRSLLDLWDRAGCGGAMVLEKDFSPTLAGDDRARDRDQILRWLEVVPGLIARSSDARVRLGVKVMNALHDDAFQIEMVRSLVQRADPAPAFLVVFNRLFDARAGVAYGGWELSDRNLRVLDGLRGADVPLPPLSATGNICSGRMMVEYARRGCENGQLHTFFQIPLSEYTATAGTRSARALHTLMLHSSSGIAVWLKHLHEAGQLEPRDGHIRFADLVAAARTGRTTDQLAIGLVGLPPTEGRRRGAKS